MHRTYYRKFIKHNILYEVDTRSVRPFSVHTRILLDDNIIQCYLYHTVHRPVHSTQYSTQYTVHSTQYTDQYTVHRPVHSTQNSTQYTEQYTVHSTQCSILLHSFCDIILCVDNVITQTYTGGQ